MVNDYRLRVKPITTAKKTPESSQIRDSFETPRYAVELLLPFIPENINCVWEPACGNLRISKVIRESGIDTLNSDIRILSDGVTYFNFLTDTNRTDIHRDCAIITNPPFSVKEQFIEKAFEYGVAFAFLVNADYSGQQISWIERGCEKIIPKRRISYITPNMLTRINFGEGTDFNRIEDVSGKILKKYSSAQFHSIWLCYGFGLGKTETFVDLPLTNMERFY